MYKPFWLQAEGLKIPFNHLLTIQFLSTKEGDNDNSKLREITSKLKIDLFNHGINTNWNSKTHKVELQLKNYRLYGVYAIIYLKWRAIWLTDKR